MPTPRFLAGERLPAGKLQLLGSDETIPWTPTIVATTTNPTYGTGAVREGWYIQRGMSCVGSAIISFGTSMSGGSGFWSFPLPVPFADPLPAVDPGIARIPAGQVQFVDVSASAAKVGVAMIAGGGPDISFAVDGNIGFITATSPWTWAAGDIIAWSFDYPADWP